jgi:hypothetical protein
MSTAKLNTIPRMVFERKVGRNWKASEERDICTDATTVYHHLSEDMVYRFIHKSPMVRRIKRVNNYDGTVTIVVTYDNDHRKVYVVPEM